LFLERSAVIDQQLFRASRVLLSFWLETFHELCQDSLL